MTTSLLPTTERALLHRLAVTQSTNRVPSLIAALVRDGELIWSGSRGHNDGERPTTDTQYRIGSITKTFVAVLVMRLRDEGRLDLADPLEDYVPGTAIGKYSLGQILSHSTALSAEPAGQWWERAVGVDAETFVASVDSGSTRPTPQHVFHYSNTGFGLLGEVVARLRGVDWATALRTEILEPLGLNRTTLAPESPNAPGWAVHPWADVLLPEPSEDAHAMAPAGQLWSTVDDMARWLRFLCGETADVLHPRTLAEMRAPGSVDDGAEWRAGFGLGIQLTRHKGRRLAGHGGSMPGFLANVVADPAENTGAVFLANTTFGAPGTLATDLLDVLQEHEPRIPEEWEPTTPVPSELLELTGQWYWGPQPYVLRITSDGMLDLQPWQGRGRASRFRRNTDGNWVGLDGYYAGEPLRVIRSADGVPSYLDLATFVFTRTPYDPTAAVPGGVDQWQPLD